MQAVTGAQARELKCHTLLQVGRTYLDFLLAKGEFQTAARLCVNILGLYYQGSIIKSFARSAMLIIEQVKTNPCGRMKFSNLLDCTSCGRSLRTCHEASAAWIRTFTKWSSLNS